MKKRKETYYIIPETEFLDKLGIKEKEVTATVVRFRNEKKVLEVYVK